jgi:peroxiredoxin Q/BCP
VVEKYGVWKEKSMYGKKYMGIMRESFLIGKDGLILKHYEKVNPILHPKEVLKDIAFMKNL